MNKYNWKEFLKAAGIRMLKTFAQGCISMIGADMVSILDLDWVQILGVGATMAVLSFLTSLAGLPEVDDVKIYDLTTKQ